MELDQVSTNLIKIALYLNKIVSGSVSEIWISPSIQQSLNASLPTVAELPEVIKITSQLIEKLEDKRRRTYLKEMLSSLEFQLTNTHQKVPYTIYSEHVFGTKIQRVTDAEIHGLENEISLLEHKLGKSRSEICSQFVLQADEYVTEFESDVAKIKNKLPQYILSYTDEGFEIEITNQKPWSAYNEHTSPYRSKLILNADVHLTKIDLYRLACHEAYGGHHSELSNKDKLLVQEHKGEHGLVITFSPQVFVSEAIAEGMYVLLGILDKNNEEQMIIWYYDRLIFALQNLATFLYIDDGLSKEKIDTVLKEYAITDDTRKNILNFSCDPLFSKYAPIYYSAFSFIENLYKNTPDKENLIKTLFFQPCTPSLLV